MHLLLRSFFLVLFLASFYVRAQAQPTITTQPLTLTSICPGSPLDVPFLLTGSVAAGNAFSVQLTKGTELITLPATTVVGNPATGLYTATTTLASSLGAGSYKVRILTSSPALVGSDSPTALFVKTMPLVAPTIQAQPIGNYTSQYTFCQNDLPLSLSVLVGPVPDNYRVLYDLGTGLSSTSQRTFTPPVINTAAVSRTTYNVRYVVIDEAKGCSPVEQPGTVAYLNAEVKFRPAAPSLPAASLTYCQNQTASPLTAINSGGAELLWYTASGTLLTGAALTPPTTTAGTVRYEVSQSVDRCESAKVALSVTVQPASAAPTAPKTLIELCRGFAATPLMANGTNLVWTDPTGTTSTVAPTPSTLNASKTSEGDVYYVSQTGTNGCPSLRLAIRVLVQAQPTLSLSGGKNVNLGLDLPLQLTFTGTGPYQYRITSNPGSITLTGRATKDTAVVVSPVQSAVYQVAEVSNACGIGLPGSPATATVTVLVPTIRTLTLQSATACAGSTVTATFQTTGTFNPGSAFRLQVARTNSDTTKLSYTDLVVMQQVGTTQLTGALPATATSGTYLVRVVATNPKIPIVGTPSATTLTVLGPVSASLTTTTPTINEGEVAKLVVTFTGDGPWTFAYRDSTTVFGPVQTATAATSPYTVDLKPNRTTVYQLTSLSNGCSVSTNLPGRVVVTVAPLLATEPLAGLLSVYPVPATSQVTVRLDPSLLTEPVTLILLDETGRLVLKQDTRQQHTPLWLAGQPAGVYVLQILTGGQLVSRRLVKY